jgi:hypothetical protein
LLRIFDIQLVFAFLVHKSELNSFAVVALVLLINGCDKFF